MHKQFMCLIYIKIFYPLTDLLFDCSFDKERKMFLGWQGIYTFVGVAVVIAAVLIFFAKVTK